MYECNYLMLIMRLCSCNDDFLMVHDNDADWSLCRESVLLFEYACVFVLYRMHMYTYTLHNLLYLSMKHRSAYLADAPLYIKTETCFHCICIVNFLHQWNESCCIWMNDVLIPYWLWAKIVHLLELVYNAYTGASQKIRIWWKSLFFYFL